MKTVILHVKTFIFHSIGIGNDNFVHILGKSTYKYDFIYILGSGAGLGTTASMLVIGYNFKRKRNIALGFVCSGMGAGLFALASLMHLAREYYGSTGFFIVQAAMSLNIVVFGATYFPSKLEKHAQEMRMFNNVDALPNGNTNLRFIEVYKQYFKALNNKPIFLLSFGMFFYCVGTHLIYLHLPVYIVHKGFSKTQASYMVSLKGIFAVIGRLLTGFVASLHKSVDIWLYSGSFLVLSVATIVYPHISNTLAGNIGYAVVLGLFFGSCYVLITSVNLSFVDIKHVSAALAFEFFVGGIGSLLGPEFAGKCTKRYVSFISKILISQNSFKCFIHLSNFSLYSK
jgi:hypothetical protein